MSWPQPVSTFTQTSTKGASHGGAQTTTHETYEEHTVTNGEAFSSSESWANGTAVDSAHAADLWFSYRVRNSGTEYAREIGNLAFNVYIGDDPNPVFTYYVAADLGGDGKFRNFMPGEEHVFSSRTKNHAVPLTLEQMKALDVEAGCDLRKANGEVQPGQTCRGGKIRVVVEDFSYGVDELFYQDALAAGVRVAIDNGPDDDGNDLVDSYVIPTWGEGDTVQDVIGRYFPTERDAEGNIVALSALERRGGSRSWCAETRQEGDRTWCKHALSTADWWNIYLNNLGDGTASLKDTPARANSVAFFRFNRDRDLDGYSDRTEERLGTDPLSPASHPKPELIAGVYTAPAAAGSNTRTATLSLLNTGPYDAYEVEAIMIAPDDSVTITNNTVGGSGRVRAGRQVVVGSRIKVQDPLPSQWTQPGHALPAAGGYFTDTARDRTYTFKASCPTPGGCTVGEGNWTLAWSDDSGTSGTLSFAQGYKSPDPLAVGGLGVKLGLLTGKVLDGESFTVTASAPRDTFQYTINKTPYTEPLAV